jgi:hypothetical protein
MAIGEVETDKSDCPTEIVPKIEKTEVTVNPFSDIIVQKPSEETAQDEKSLEEAIKEKRRKEREQKKLTRKVKNNSNLISFDDEDAGVRTLFHDILVL